MNLPRRAQIYDMVSSTVIQRLVSEQGPGVCWYPPTINGWIWNLEQRDHKGTLRDGKNHWDYFVVYLPSSLPRVSNDVPVTSLEFLPVLHFVPSFVFSQGQAIKKAQKKRPPGPQDLQGPSTYKDSPPLGRTGGGLIRGH